MSRYFKSFNPTYKAKYGTIYRLGNKKLGNDTVIFNLQPAHKCISFDLGLCQLKDKKQCYAYRDEQRYKNTLTYRQRQEAFFNSEAFIHVFIEDIIQLKKKYPYIKYLRFNEAGDIRNKQDLFKLCFISEWLKHYGITTYTYTARKDIKEELSIKEATYVNNSGIVINGSGFKWHNSYNAYSDKDIIGLFMKYDNSFVSCPGSCKHCKLCKTKHNKPIKVKVF